MEGIGGALFEYVDFGNGRIANPHFAQYRVPRFPDVPRIETVVLDRKDLPPAGAGETPLVALAPAVGNAIFAASGRPPDCRPGSHRGTARDSCDRESGGSGLTPSC